MPPATSVQDPFAFSADGYHFVFNKTKIYHCFANNTIYVVGVFTYNGNAGIYIKFQLRRNRKDEWGCLVGGTDWRVLPRPEEVGKLDLCPAKKFRDETFDTQSEDYLTKLAHFNIERIENGKKEITPIIYNDNLVKARREILRYSIQTLISVYHDKPLLTTEQWLDFFKQYDAITGSIITPQTVAKTNGKSCMQQMVCRDNVGYEQVLEVGKTYKVVPTHDDMIEVLLENGERIRLFEDRFATAD